MLIHQHVPQQERLIKLNELAVSQMKSLLGNLTLKKMDNI